MGFKEFFAPKTEMEDGAQTLEERRGGMERGPELPDDSGGWDKLPELPDDSGEWDKLPELPDDSGWCEKTPESHSVSGNESVDTAESNASDAPRKQGGSYGEVFQEGEGETHEVHHIPADSVSPLERNDGPAIKMEKADHQKTASWGSSRDAREYREKQKELIEQGKFPEAIQMDIDDIREKFGDKYDEAINEMLEYVDKLEKEERIDA